MNKDTKNVLIVISVILIVILLWPKSKGQNIGKILKNNNYEEKELASMNTYSKGKLMFIIYKSEKTITISYEDDFSTATTTLDNIDKIENSTCKLDLKNESKSNCDDKNKKWLEKANKKIKTELKNLKIKY